MIQVFEHIVNLAKDHSDLSDENQNEVNELLKSFTELNESLSMLKEKNEVNDIGEEEENEPSDKIIRCKIFLDLSGKTNILYKLKNNEFVKTEPTIGYNIESIPHNDYRFDIWEVGGQDRIRCLWRHYCYNTDLVIYVVDSSDANRFDEAKTELQNLLKNDDLKECIILIYANKQDLPRVVNIDELNDRLGIENINNRKLKIQGVSALTGNGLYEGLDWAIEQIKSNE